MTDIEIEIARFQKHDRIADRIQMAMAVCALLCGAILIVTAWAL